MKKPKHLNKYNFDDFSEEYYLKTYLGSKVLVVYYDSSQDTVTIWRKGDVFVNCNKEDLLASEEEIHKVAELLRKKTGGKNRRSSLQEYMENYVIIPDLPRGIDCARAPVWMTCRPSSPISFPTYYANAMEE